MLESLRKQIVRMTSEREFSISSRKSRTFIIVVSPWLQAAREWVNHLSPLENGDAHHFYPWIVLDYDPGAFAEEARKAFTSAYDIGRVHSELSRSSVLQETNQVVVLADLGEENASGRVDSAIAAIRELAAEKSRPEAPVYWTGIFVTRRAGSGSIAGADRETVHAASQPPPNAAASTAKQVFAGLPADLFDRLFVVDVTNPKGAEISHENDQFCLIGHLLSFLITFPIVNNSAEFIQWLGQNDASNGLLTGFSAFSFALPMNQIIETIAMAQGAEVMREAVLAEENRERFRYYLRNFEQKNALATSIALRSAMVSDVEYPLIDPAGSLAAFEFGNVSSYIAAMDAIDASLPEIAQENGKRMRQIGERRLREWNESLEDHLESMIAREKGGLPMARRFLESLLDHVESLMPPEPKPPEYEDPGVWIRRLEAFIARIPRAEAVYTRAGLLALGAELALPYSLAGPIGNLILRLITPLLSFLLGALVISLRNHEASQYAIRIEKAIRGKYVALLEFAVLKEIRVALEGIREIARRDLADIDAALGRIKTITAHFKENYRPDLPPESAFWKHIVRDRNAFLDLQRHCNFDATKSVKEYFERSHSLRLWRRLLGAKLQEPDAWEWTLVEQAAEIMVPGCGEIINLDIRDCFQSGGSEHATLRSTVVNAVQPFVVIDPLMPSKGIVRKYVMLEAGAAGEKPMLEPFIENLSQHMSMLRIGSRSQYRFSFYGFCEGVKLADLQFR